MALTLRAVPSSGATRGEVTVQPAYFTSSLFVDALRTDVRTLARTFEEDLVNTASAAQRLQVKPYALFRRAWMRLGWQWLHLKVLEPRARETFLRVVFRAFLENIATTESFAVRTTGLFGLYTFYMAQPAASTPGMYTMHSIPIPIDTYETLLSFPSSLADAEKIIKPHVIYMLQMLHSRFLIMPPARYYAQNPRNLPREIVSPSSDLNKVGEGAKQKRAGRPSKAEKAQRMRAAMLELDRWLDNSESPSTGTLFVSDPAGAAARLSGSWRPYADANETTHIMLTQRPVFSLHSYRAKRAAAIQALGGEGEGAIDRASNRVLARLREIDAAAAERGLEVGTEGDELSGIERVENAVKARQMLSLLDAGGLS